MIASNNHSWALVTIIDINGHQWQFNGNEMAINGNQMRHIKCVNSSKWHNAHKRLWINAMKWPLIVIKFVVMAIRGLGAVPQAEDTKPIFPCHKETPRHTPIFSATRIHRKAHMTGHHPFHGRAQPSLGRRFREVAAPIREADDGLLWKPCHQRKRF